jgi:hypothetical protein
MAVLGVFGGLVSALYGIASNSPLAVTLAVGLVLASIEVIVLTKAAGGFSAVLIPVLAVNSVLLSSMFLWDGIRVESIVSVKLRVTEEYHIQAAVIGIVFSAAYTAGALLAGPQPVRITLAQIGKSISELGQTFKIPDGALVITGYAGILLTIYGRQGGLLQGSYNVVDGPSWAVALSNAIAPLAILVLSIVASKPGPWRWLAIVGIGIWFLLLFARASRTIAVFPIILLFARTFTSGARVRPHSVALVVIGTIFLMQLPLVGRANPDGVGIIPLTQQVLSRPEEIFSGFSLGGILGNILFTGPLTGVVANRQIPLEAFWVSINPLPGSWAGWSEYKGILRVDSSTPYNALGELGAQGWFALVAVAFAVGLLLALSTRIASRLDGAFALAASLLVLGITVFFSVSILQYNLRSSVRLIWYILGGLTLIWMASVAIKPRRASSTGNQHTHADPMSDLSQPSQIAGKD